MSLLSLPTTLILVVAELALLVFGRRRVMPVDGRAGRFVVGGNAIALAALAVAALSDALVLGVGVWTGDLFGSDDSIGLAALLVASGLVPPLAHGAALAGTAAGLVVLARRLQTSGLGDRDAEGETALP